MTLALVTTFFTSPRRQRAILYTYTTFCNPHKCSFNLYVLLKASSSLSLILLCSTVDLAIYFKEKIKEKIKIISLYFALSLSFSLTYTCFASFSWYTLLVSYPIVSFHLVHAFRTYVFLGVRQSLCSGRSAHPTTSVSKSEVVYAIVIQILLVKDRFSKGHVSHFWPRSYQQ